MVIRIPEIDKKKVHEGSQMGVHNHPKTFQVYVHNHPRDCNVGQWTGKVALVLEMIQPTLWPHPRVIVYFVHTFEMLHIQ